MNRLPFEQPVEDIVYLKICEGISLHKRAMKALLEDGGFNHDESTLLYYDVINEALETLNDAFLYAECSPHHKMKKVIKALDDYFRIIDAVAEDGIFICALTETEVIKMTAEAGQILDLSEQYSRECIDITDFPSDES